MTLCRDDRPKTAFAIDPLLGNLTIRDSSSLDYELDDTVTLYVRVRDRLSSTIQPFDVLLDDQGDPPTIQCDFDEDIHTGVPAMVTGLRLDTAQQAVLDHGMNSSSLTLPVCAYREVSETASRDATIGSALLASDQDGENYGFFAIPITGGPSETFASATDFV